MKRFAWIGAVLVAALSGCGSDDSVSPTPDLADAWVGEYAGPGSYVLSNGESGTDEMTLTIEAATPKEVMIAAVLQYGSRNTEQATAFAILAPDDPNELEMTYRQGTTRIAFLMTREDDALTGIISTSTLRINGNWTEDQRMEFDLVRQ
jgi:hypothetical protein